MLSSYCPPSALSTRLAIVALLFALVAACGGHQSAPVTAPALTPSTSEDGQVVPDRSAIDRGIEAAHSGRLRAAAGWFDEAIARGESALAARQNRAVVRAAQGRYNDAIDDAVAAVELGGGDAALRVLAGIQLRAGYVDATLTTLGQIEESNAVGTVLRALALGMTGDVELAQRTLQDVLSTDALGPVELNNLGILSEQLGEIDAARDLYNRAIAADPDACQPWRNLGMLLMRAGDTTGAAGALRRYLELAPRSVSDRGVIEGRVDRLDG